MIGTLKPSDVAFTDPNTGVKAAPNELCVVLAVPLTYPDLVVVIVTVADAPGGTLVTVTSLVVVSRTATESIGVDAAAHA